MDRVNRPLNISCSGRQGGELLFLFGKFKAFVKTYADLKLSETIEYGKNL